MRIHPLRSLAAILITFAAVAAMQLVMLPAQAHDELVSSDPADGAQLTTAPATVTLVFSDTLKKPAYAAVTFGDIEQKATATIKGDTLVVDTSSIPAGEAGQPVPWTIAYRIVSADGHPVQGAVGFTVTPDASRPRSAGPPTANAAPSATSTGGSAASTTPTPSASATTAVASAPASTKAADDSGSGFVWWIPGVALVGAGLAGALLINRRRSGGDDGQE